MIRILLNNKKFIRIAELIVIVSILLSGYILFAYERKNHNPDYNKNWAAFYFADPSAPEKGVTLENHLGEDTEFNFCLVSDSDDLMEPNDLSCNLDTVIQSETKKVTAGNSFNWVYSFPGESGKYWAVVEYTDGDVLKHKDLSFETK